MNEVTKLLLGDDTHCSAVSIWVPTCCIDYWFVASCGLQARSKGNQVKRGWRWQGGKLFFGGVADQSDLIKVIQPVLPTTFLCLFSSVYARRVISTTERKMDGEV